jgi:hypothetical protein
MIDTYQIEIILLFVDQLCERIICKLLSSGHQSNFRLSVLLLSRVNEMIPFEWFFA